MPGGASKPDDVVSECLMMTKWVWARRLVVLAACGRPTATARVIEPNPDLSKVQAIQVAAIDDDRAALIFARARGAAAGDEMVLAVSRGATSDWAISTPCDPDAWRKLGP
jgi:hypothetical protein